MAESGKQQVDQFEELIAKAPKGIRLSSGLWPRYLRGDVMPLGSLERHHAGLVQRLDGRYPTTTKVFHHAIWELIDFDRMLGPSRLQALYLGLGDGVWKRFVHSSKGAQGTPVATTGPFWKIHRTTEDLQRSISHIPGLDGLAVCLIEARMAYFTQDQKNFAIAVLGACSHLRKYAKAQKFQFSKLLSALLVLEHMCLALVQNMTETKKSTTGGTDLQKLIQLQYADWKKRAEDHLGSLSKPAGALFAKWVNQTVDAKFTW